MNPHEITEAPVRDAEGPFIASADVRRAEEELVVDELLVEDVSIDGMCGVY
jgi:mycofactocin precursor